MSDPIHLHATQEVLHLTGTAPEIIHMHVGLVGSVGPPGPQGVPGADATWLSITQADYDALPSHDPSTLYVIIG